MLFFFIEGSCMYNTFFEQTIVGVGPQRNFGFPLPLNECRWYLCVMVMLLGLPVGYPWERTIGICVHGNSTHKALKQSKTICFFC